MVFILIYLSDLSPAIASSAFASPASSSPAFAYSASAKPAPADGVVQRRGDLRTLPSVDLVPGDDDIIIPFGKTLPDASPALPHESSGPVSLHAVSNLLAGEKCRSAVAQSVLHEKQNDIAVSHGSSLAVDPAKILSVSQDFLLQHFPGTMSIQKDL